MDTRRNHFPPYHPVRHSPCCCCFHFDMVYEELQHDNAPVGEPGSYIGVAVDDIPNGASGAAINWWASVAVAPFGGCGKSFDDREVDFLERRYVVTLTNWRGSGSGYSDRSDSEALPV